MIANCLLSLLRTSVHPGALQGHKTDAKMGFVRSCFTVLASLVWLCPTAAFLQRAATARGANLLRPPLKRWRSATSMTREGLVLDPSETAGECSSIGMPRVVRYLSETGDRYVMWYQGRDKTIEPEVVPLSTGRIWKVTPNFLPLGRSTPPRAPNSECDRPGRRLLFFLQFCYYEPSLPFTASSVPVLSLSSCSAFRLSRQNRPTASHGRRH